MQTSSARNVLSMKSGTISSSLPLSNSTESSAKDFIVLTKPSVTLLVVLSAITGIILAPEQTNPIAAITCVIATALGSASSASFNMWYDRDIDALMVRTKNRPIPSGAIHPDDGLAFSITLGILALTLMAACVNYLSSFILLLSIIFYCGIYTAWLKRKTDQNIVIGGIAGSLPPIIGWLSVNQTIGAAPIILFIIIFLWTPAHFWALAIYRKQEYSTCNVPMLPVTRGIHYTCKCILFYCVATVVSSLLMPLACQTSWIYVSTACILGFRFMQLAFMLNFYQSKQLAIKLFFFSIFYLFALLTTLIIDQYV